MTFHAPVVCSGAPFTAVITRRVRGRAAGLTEYYSQPHPNMQRPNGGDRKARDARAGRPGRAARSDRHNGPHTKG